MEENVNVLAATASAVALSESASIICGHSNVLADWFSNQLLVLRGIISVAGNSISAIPNPSINTAIITGSLA